MSSVVIRNVASNWGGMGLSIVVAFVMTPYVIGKLGVTGYGFWALLQSLIAYMFLLDFGVRSSMTRHLAKYLVLSDDRQVNHIVNTGLAVYLTVSMVVAGLSVALAAGFDRWFVVEEVDLWTIRWAVLLVGWSMALQFPAAVFESVMTGHQRFDLVNLSLLASLGFRTVWTVVALEGGYGVRGLSWATFLSAMFLLGLNYVLARRVYPPLQIQLSQASRATVALLGNHSISAFIMIGAMRLITDAGNVIVGIFAGVSMVSLYAVASSLTNYVLGVVSGISTTISPLASEYDARGDSAGLKTLCLRGTKGILLVALPILSTFVLGGDLFITLWIGDALLGSYAPLVLLSGAWTMNILTLASSCTLIGLSRHRTAAWFVLGQALLDVVLSLVLVRFYGVAGVAAGAMLAAVVMNIAIQIHALRVFDIPVVVFAGKAVAPAVLALIPFVVCLPAALAVLHPTGLLEYFLCVGVAVGAYVALLPWTGLTAVERSEAKEYVLRWWGGGGRLA